MKQCNFKITFNFSFLIAFLLLFLIEVLIAKYFFDRLIRAFIGDVLVVILIYFFCRIFIKAHNKQIAFGVFIFACTIEVLQAFHLVKLLGLEGNKIASVILGTTFDWKDILAYFIGFFICLKIK